MAPARPGRTRTAPPRMPDQFPFRGRYLAYVLFDATGALYLLAALVALRVIWALGSGEAAFVAVQRQLARPGAVLFHALALAGVCFVAVRFFRLFPKAQPPRIGPLRPPPERAIAGLLYGAWVAVAALLSFALAGGLSG
jgi:fumarate reductase subunit C